MHLQHPHPSHYPQHSNPNHLHNNPSKHYPGSGNSSHNPSTFTSPTSSEPPSPTLSSSSSASNSATPLSLSALSAAAYKYEQQQQQQQQQQQMQQQQMQQQQMQQMQMQQQQQQMFMARPAPNGGGSRTPTRTSPPGGRSSHNSSHSTTPYHTAPHTPSPSQPASANSSLSGQHMRANADQLKTFLRKKACLYEVDTSRAISIVTWLVGRELSSLKGHFTRQELQTAIHDIVKPQIDYNQITRTKVNRCMQIILNSCFHYVIPKPGGFDEASASFFAKKFASEVADDKYLLSSLGGVWAGLEPNFASFVEASNRLCETGFTRDNNEDDPNTVLLCFNDNIRSAEDVIFSHNEFIRDIAITNNLKMTPEDWRFFYLGTVDQVPRMVGVSGSPEQMRDAVQHEAFFVNTGTLGDDECGKMSEKSLLRFRVSFCEKRYTHECRNCSFAHVEVDGGWLRRNPEQHQYAPNLCPHVTFNKKLGSFVNTCELGLKCGFAHSHEEVNFHPQTYKTHACNRSTKDIAADEFAAAEGPGADGAGMVRCRGASMDVCPCVHYDGYAAPERTHAGRISGPTAAVHHQPHVAAVATRNSGSFLGPHVAGGDAAANDNFVPTVAPMLYGGNAPLSKFEETLRLPGLQTLFRQNCKALLRWAGEEEGRGFE